MTNGLNKAMSCADVVQKREYIHRVLISENGAMSRGSLARRTGIPRSTLFDYLEKLIQRGVVTKYAQKKGRTPGRAKVYYEVIPELEESR